MQCIRTISIVQGSFSFYHVHCTFSLWVHVHFELIKISLVGWKEIGILIKPT